MNRPASKPAQSNHMEIRHEGDLVVLCFPSGRVDGTAVTELFEAASQLFAGRGGKVLVDLTGVNYVNSGGVGIMVTLQRRAMTENARLHIAIPSDKVRETFEVMHLHRVLSIYQTTGEAIAAFGGSRS